MELDKDYINYLRAMGEETGDPKYLWQCIAVLVGVIEELQQEEISENESPNLTGQFKIQPPAGKGYPKGPPQSIIS